MKIWVLWHWTRWRPQSSGVSSSSHLRVQHFAQGKSRNENLQLIVIWIGSNFRLISAQHLGRWKETLASFALSHSHTHSTFFICMFPHVRGIPGPVCFTSWSFSARTSPACFCRFVLSAAVRSRSHSIHFCWRTDLIGDPAAQVYSHRSRHRFSTLNPLILFSSLQQLSFQKCRRDSLLSGGTSSSLRLKWILSCETNKPPSGSIALSAFRCDGGLGSGVCWELRVSNVYSEDSPDAGVHQRAKVK